MRDEITPMLNGLESPLQNASGIEQSNEIGELMGALAKAQGKISGAEKTAKNPYFKSNYADLYTVIESCRPHLSANGISFIQGNHYDPVTEAFYVATQLSHTSGQWVRTMVYIPLTKLDPQGVGGAVTYGRRYGLSGLVGIGQFDDDGNSLMTYTPSEKEITRFAELLDHPAFKGVKSDTKKWWSKLDTPEMVTTGLQTMENRTTTHDKRKNKTVNNEVVRV